MKKYITRKNSVSVCHKDNCVHADGDNANWITLSVVITILLFGIAALLRTN